jgi:acetate kinase
MRVLVLNAGSSSLKYQLIELDDPEQRTRGLIERIGEAGSEVPDHVVAAEQVLAQLGAHPDAVGHRIVHGGTRFVAPALVDADVERGIEELADLAPLHNPPGLAGIRAARAVLPDVPHVRPCPTMPPRTRSTGMSPRPMASGATGSTAPRTSPSPAAPPR